MWLSLVALVQAAEDPCAFEVVDGRAPQAEQAITFAPRSASLLPDAKPAISGLACLLERDPALKVRIEVHTDAMGAESYNLRSSQERADAIRAALVAEGVSEARAEAVGYGELLPIAEGTDAASHAKNRRIEIYLGQTFARPPVPKLPPPPAPAPAPEPAPAPRPVEWCARIHTITASTPPRWTGGTCTQDAVSWRCTLRETTTRLAEELSACASATRDGESLYVRIPAGVLVLSPDPVGSVLTLR